MSYKLIDTDILAKSIENAFQEGRYFQSNRDESALFGRIEKLMEEYDSEDIPNVETFQAQAMLADIREILANPETYGGESLEKLGLIINILCKD